MGSRGHRGRQIDLQVWADREHGDRQIDLQVWADREHGDRQIDLQVWAVGRKRAWRQADVSSGMGR